MNDRFEFDRLMDEVSVGHVPIDHLLARGRAAKRRQRRAVVAGAAAAMALVVGGSAVAAQGMLSRYDSKDIDPIGAPSTPSGSEAAEPSPKDPLPLKPDGRAVDTNAVHEAATPLSECPELLAFLTSPEVNEFQTKHFGDPYTPHTRFWPACPDVDYMRAMYEAGRARVLGGER